MRILVTGSSGLIGSVAVRRLEAQGHRMTRLVHRAPAPGEAAVRWDPYAESMDAASLAGHDAVLHLAGESIAAGRWTAEKKARIRESRVRGTALLARTLAGLGDRPKTLLAASAIGFYGDRGDESLDEDSASGRGFLPEVCRDWEAAARPAQEAGVRVVNLRMGLVLNAHGGALARMLPLFRLGLGGPLGSGRQYVSWITLDDLVAAVELLLTEESIRGPVNLVSPQPVTNRELGRTLGRVLRRPAILPTPAFALRLVLGEMADALLLSSARVLPKRLLAAGFAFGDSALEPALRRMLG